MMETSMHIGNLVIYEPVTVFTDCLIMMLCLIFFRKLEPTDESIQNWRFFFLFLGISTIIGACSHAFFKIHVGWQYKFFWLTMQLLNGVAVYFAQKATLVSILKTSRYFNFWKWSYIIQLIVFIVILFSVQKFLVTVIENVIGLVPIIIIHFEAKKKENYQKWVGYGISVSFISGVIHATKTSLHAYFNYNDIAHVFIMISLTIIYIGIKRKSISLPAT